MSRFIIQGGKTITGTHRVSGNKNAALPMIAASLLSAEPVTLRNVPDIADITSMLEAAKSFGTAITRNLEDGSVVLATPKVRTARIDASLAAKGNSEILGAETVDRGYVSVETELSRLGAAISRE